MALLEQRKNLVLKLLIRVVVGICYIPPLGF